MKKEREKFLILLAEDNEVNIKMMVVMLQEAGYKTASVLNGQQAVSFLSIANADLVLMDIHMPTMDGFKATREIRLLNKPAGKVPILAITAHGVTGEKEKYLEAGMNDYISKPIHPKELIQKIDEWLGISSKGSAEQINIEMNLKVLDHNTLETISLGDKDFLQDLLHTYIKDIGIRLDNLSSAFRNKDIKKVILESHTIKGASLSIGANKIGEEALAIEASGKNNDLAGAESRYNDLAEAFNEVKKHILEYLK